MLTKSFEERQVHIAFRPHDETFEVTDAAIAKDPEFISDITALWRPDGYKSSFRQFVSRLGDARGQESDDREQDHLEERIDRVRDLRDFRFQVIELGAGVNEEQVAEIFVRVNSKGVQLNQADFILTLMSVHWEKGRRELEAFCRDAVDPVVKGPSPRNAFIDPSPDQLLRAGVGLAFRRGRLQHVYSILRGKDLETGEVSADRRDVQFEQLRVAQDDVIDLTNWFEFLKCLTHAGFRSRRMITSENALIYTYILWLIGRRDFGIDLKTLRGVIARWFFMAHTTGRYTSSPESQIEADLARINTLAPGDGAAFCADLDGNVRARFTGDYWAISLPNRLDTASARSPVLYAYWAALSLLDAELLFSGLRIRELLDPSVSAPRSIERHHLFLKAFLAGKGTVGIRAVNAIAHMAFLDWPDNATISADDPLAYWPIMTERMDEAQLKRQVYWHALPVGWEQLDYPTFLDRRRQLNRSRRPGWAADLYRYLLRCHIVPRFGQVPVGRITTVDIGAWLSDLHGTHLSPNTVAKAYRLLQGIMGGATDAGLIARSPCTIKGAGTERDEEMRIATPEQVAALAAAVGPRWEAIVSPPPTAGSAGASWPGCGDATSTS